MTRIEARGYIASGQYREQRTPQHVQNLVIRDYCTKNNLEYILSRAEYSFSCECLSQLEACLADGYKHIVFFSIRQLPKGKRQRLDLYKKSLERAIVLHFACEGLSARDIAGFGEVELLISIIDSGVGDEESLSTIRAIIKG